jgi:hypothetical protein
MRPSASTAAGFKKPQPVSYAEAAATDRLARGFRLADCWRRPNAEIRTREHLMLGEVNALIEAAKANRWGHRYATG